MDSQLLPSSLGLSFDLTMFAIESRIILNARDNSSLLIFSFSFMNVSNLDDIEAYAAKRVYI